MAVVAVAGGLGHVGRTIIETLKDNTKHSVVALTRKAPQDPVDFSVKVVDYDNVDDIASFLKKSSIEVVISALRVASLESGVAEINLAKAAAKSKTTKRFVASEWSTVVPENELGPHDQARKETRDFLRGETDLEWTRFICGHFLIDYAGQPYIRSYMKPDLHFGIDVENKAAFIPGTGNGTIAFSYTYDLAKFVVAALDLPEWEEETISWSDKATWNEVVALGEKARRTKFTVNYDPVEKLRKGEISELPGQVQLYSFLPKPFLQGLVSRWGLMAIQGHWNLPEENSLNRRFPEIETLKVKDAFKGWEGK
ncbi:hypothetical protein MRS44_016674 [Fusarium solani]|uniref:uncharacterized protein n=1 Tax=Fusarium solani TaxID=169388 RepID=UPI0032C40E3B|nr:hypothetical protein MRS44_016674 [Fusarium solani]